LWGSDNNADVATIYTGDQHGGPLVPAPLVVNIPGGAPTGQVNNPTKPFAVQSGGASGIADEMHGLLGTLHAVHSED
jgi:hypothetical protein